ncbi:MAG: hypothetical protein ABI693_07890 [Bryobacteraceae bacterium]
MRKLMLAVLVSTAVVFGAEGGKLPYRFAPSGLPGQISNATVEPAPDAQPLPSGFHSPDVDLTMMARWFLRHLNKNPRPNLDYEPVFYVRPLSVPPSPDGHDAIVPGDTDARMDWEYRNMREILGQTEPGVVEKGLHARVLGYLRHDGLAWVPPGHYMEGEVYNGKNVGPEKLVSTWATAKILRSLSEEYKRTHREQDRQLARRNFLALKKLAEWNTGRAYYPGGSGAWLDGKWVKPQMPTAAVEPIVSYWEATGDGEALEFARAVADGLLADAELLPPQNSRLLPNGEFHGHMHSTMHGVWGVAHLGAILNEPRYVDWAKSVYDYASQFGPGTGWMQAALWSDSVRELSETCATSDMVSTAAWIARAGFPQYWDHVERALRNYIRPQQFFVTPQYEALYRKENTDKDPAAVEAGLARMRDLQGADMGGPAPNDWINWVAGEKECGPYKTPYGCMAMFGCCVPEGMRALHTAWMGVVESGKNNAVYVNLSLTRTSQWADVVSSLPKAGRLDVTARRAGAYYLRPPAWAPRGEVRVLRNGKAEPIAWAGPGLAYLSLNDVRTGDRLTLTYPLVTFQQVWGNWPSRPDLKLTISWRGNIVTDMLPKGKGLPIDFSNLPPLPDLPE